MNEKKFLEIDGSLGEGGGAILRLSAAFSVLYNIPIRIKNIRANRPKPGLRMQHLLGLKLIADLTGSILSKCQVGSTELSFSPNNNLKKREIDIHIPTAASIGLLLQPIQIACLGFKDDTEIAISINGGATFGKWAPSINYLEQITFPIFKKSGLSIEINTQKHGFYPKGGAKVYCSIKLPKSELNPLNITEIGEIQSIRGEIIVTSHLKQSKRSIPLRIKNSITSELKNYFDGEIEIKERWVDSLSPGVGLCLWTRSNKGALISSGTLLGERNLSSERLSKIAVNRLLKYLKKDIPVDNYLSDQLVPLLSYIKKPSTIKVLEITNHTKTNLEIFSKFNKRSYEIKKVENAFLINFF